MPILRLLLAGLVALFAVLAAVFAAALVFAMAVVAWVAQLFTGKREPVRPGPAAVHSPRRPADDVIDVESTKVPPDA